MRELSGHYKRAVHVIYIILSIYVLYTSRQGLHPLIQAPVFFAMGFFLIYMNYPVSKKTSRKAPPAILDFVMMTIAIVACIHVAVNHTYFLTHPAQATTLDTVLGTLLIIVAMEGARRSMGPVIPILGCVLLLYTYAGKYLPIPWGHAGFTFVRTIEYMYRSTTGFWGDLSQIACNLIAIFMLFGGALLATGGGQALIHLTTWLGGRMTGGGAKVALFASAAIGTVEGSAVSNVATTGVFTIPMMKSQGFDPAFAAASEACASTGGQIMPPIMGASAFIMSELIETPYIRICAAAAIPAILYFFGAFMGIDAYARRHRLGAVSREKILEAKKAINLTGLVSLAIPIGVLLGMLFTHYTPTYSALISILVSFIIFFFASRRWSMPDIKARGRKIEGALVTGAESLMGIACMMLCTQIAVGLLSMTGIAVKIANLVMSVAQNSQLLALVISAVAVTIMGMGIPTTPAYVLAASVMAPALIKLGISPIVAHLFILYYAVLSVLTPPVCAGVFAASALAGAKWERVASIAIRLALPAYLVPFMFVYSPSLLLGVQTAGGYGLVPALISSIVGIICLSGCTLGYFLGDASKPIRVLLGVAAVLLVIPETITDISGFVVAGSIAFYQIMRSRRLKKAAAVAK